MEIVVTKLISHDYQIDNFLNAFTTNALKTEDLEWNAEENRQHRFSEDIKSNDVVFSVRDIDTEEDYGFFFLKIERTQSGNNCCVITKVILDENLTQDAVCEITTCILNANYWREVLTIDSILAADKHLFYGNKKEKIFNIVAKEVAERFS